jgi:DNA-binding CsgD family transcriptional regulator
MDAKELANLVTYCESLNLPLSYVDEVKHLSYEDAKAALHFIYTNILDKKRREKEEKDLASFHSQEIARIAKESEKISQKERNQILRELKKKQLDNTLDAS